jgi:hypothetical protein
MQAVLNPVPNQGGCATQRDRPLTFSPCQSALTCPAAKNVLICRAMST